MVKLIIFFRKPADVDVFEEHFANTHVPLINAMPNLRRAAVTRALGAPRGEPPYYLIHEVYFEDMPALTYALNSPEGRAAGADLMVFAREIVSLMFAEVWGEDPFELGLMGSEPAPIEEEPAAAPPAEKSNLVAIDTSFLEKPAKPMTVEEAILGPDYKPAVQAEAPVVEAASTPGIEETPATPVAESTVAESVATEAPAIEATPAVPVTESTGVESAATEPTATEAPASETPAQTPITESTVIETQETQAEDATPTDTPAPEHPRPQ
jgi:uncharacterized protein (TIGR02118 family)